MNYFAMTPAPIVVFCYNRPDHLRATIEALSANALAAESELIVYSDGPRKEADLAPIEAIRSYLTTLKGFRSVRTVAAPKNKGLARSVIDGVTEVFELHGRIIVMEDDLLCTPDFLSYMNSSLETFGENPLVFSVSGYSFGTNAVANYTEDTALVFRASSLGWGTWKDRWKMVDWGVSDFQEFLGNYDRRNQLKNAGEDILPMIIKQQRGLINSWAVRWTYHHVKYGGYCLIPVRSKIRTTGDDGSGSNPAAATLRQDIAYGPGQIRLNPAIRPHPGVTAFIRRNNRPSIFRKLINWWKFGVW